MMVFFVIVFCFVLCFVVSVKILVVWVLSLMVVCGGDVFVFLFYISFFKGIEQKGNKILDFGKYMCGSEGFNKVFQYFMVGIMGVLIVVGVKSIV